MDPYHHRSFHKRSLFHSTFLSEFVKTIFTNGEPAQLRSHFRQKNRARVKTSRAAPTSIRVRSLERNAPSLSLSRGKIRFQIFRFFSREDCCFGANFEISIKQSRPDTTFIIEISMLRPFIKCISYYIVTSLENNHFITNDVTNVNNRK